jgi:hypothetical protein
MKTIWLVKAQSDVGIEAFYVGAVNREEALIMAAERGYDGDTVEAKEIPNKFGIQSGDWRSAL